MEIWDAYDKNKQLLGYDLIRGEEIPDDVYHLASDILVKHTDGTYLLMQRSLKKEKYPGFYEVSAGGSALKGETSLECAIRELKEETGITEGKFIYLSSIIRKKDHCISYQYLCITDCDKDSITYQKNETIGHMWVTKDEFKKFLLSSLCIKSQISRFENFIRKEFEFKK